MTVAIDVSCGTGPAVAIYREPAATHSCRPVPIIPQVVQVVLIVGAERRVATAFRRNVMPIGERLNRVAMDWNRLLK